MRHKGIHIRIAHMYQFRFRKVHTCISLDFRRLYQVFRLMTHSCKVQKSIPIGNASGLGLIVWVHPPPKKMSPAALDNYTLYLPPAQWACPLHIIPCAKFWKNENKWKESTRITLHSHLLQQLRLRPLDVGSAGWLMVQFSQLFHIS